MSTIFSKIISGEIPCHKIYEDEAHIAFLDIQPLVMGHILCVPKREIDYIFDMEPEAFAELWKFTLPVANALKKAVPCVKIGTAVIGLEVPHVHIHLVPMQTVGDLNFTQAKLNPSNSELDQMAAYIRSFLS